MRELGCGLWLTLALAGCSFRVRGVDNQTPHGQADLAMTVDVSDGAAPDLIDLAMAADLASSVVPTLAVTIDPSTTTPIDFSAAAPRDWAHWGYTQFDSFDHKNGANLISNISVTGPQVARLTSYPIGFSWSDGAAPNPSVTNTTTGVYTYGQGSGFRLTIPADTSLRTLKLWAGGQQSTVQATAHLSDGSATDVIKASSDPNNNFQRLVTVTYRAASACTLQVDWTVKSSNGFVHIQSAALP